MISDNIFAIFFAPCMITSARQLGLKLFIKIVIPVNPKHFKAKFIGNFIGDVASAFKLRNLFTPLLVACLA